jgi:E3 ubiquitin-protein ligase UBR2
MPLSEDFLELLIHIVSEKYEPFISQMDPSSRLERECIHQLCISPMAHSDIVKSIYPDNEKYTNELEFVLGKVATFRNSAPNSNAKGVYELKPEYSCQYSPYFYHYSRSEKTKSEEYQLSLKKGDKEKFFKPPESPPFTLLFARIKNLLDSDVFIRIIGCVLERIAQKSKYVSDGQLVRVLHLIGLALYEEQADFENFNFLEKSFFITKDTIKKKVVVSPASGQSLGKKLNETISVLTTESYKLLAEWVLDTAEKLVRKKLNLDDQLTSKTETERANELLAKTTSDEKELDEQMNAEKLKHAQAEKRRARLLAKYNKQQKSFIEKNQESYNETRTIVSQSSSTSNESDMNLEESVQSVNASASQSADIENAVPVVCIGANQTVVNTKDEPKKRFYCILCKEDDEINLNSLPMVLCCYVTSSKVLKTRNNLKREDDLKTPDEFDLFDPLFLKNTLNYGITTTSCGHVMHASCWQKHVETVKINESRRHARYHGFNVKRNEYLCPLC